MNLIVFLTLYFASTSCQKHEDFEGIEFEKVDKNIFNLEFFDDKENIIFTMKSKDYIPFYAHWYAEDKKFTLKLLSINGNEIFDWMLSSITNVTQLNNFVNNLEKHDFKFEIEKKKFDGKYNDLECVLSIIKKEDFQKHITEVLIKKESIDSCDFDLLKKLGEEFRLEFERFMILFGIKFAENSGEIPNFNDYEMVVYKKNFISNYLNNNDSLDNKNSLNNNDSLNDNDSLDTITLLKKTAIAVLVQTFLTVFIFGTSIFVVRYSLSKYF